MTSKSDSRHPKKATAFVVHSSGDAASPTLYFVTAAHVFLGQPATEDEEHDSSSEFDDIDTISLKFGSSSGDTFPIKKTAVHFPGALKDASDWYDNQGYDVAVIKVVAAGRAFPTLEPRLQWKSPASKQFTVYGIPFTYDGPVATPRTGQIIGSPGDYTQQAWLACDVQFDQGMSGGPALFQEGKENIVYAIVQGRASVAGDLKYLVPLSAVAGFLSATIPGLHAVVSASEGSPNSPEKPVVARVQELGRFRSTEEGMIP